MQSQLTHATDQLDAQIELNTQARKFLKRLCAWLDRYNLEYKCSGFSPVITLDLWNGGGPGMTVFFSTSLDRPNSFPPDKHAGAAVHVMSINWLCVGVHWTLDLSAWDGIIELSVPSENPPVELFGQKVMNFLRQKTGQEEPTFPLQLPARDFFPLITRLLSRMIELRQEARRAR